MFFILVFDSPRDTTLMTLSIWLHVTAVFRWNVLHNDPPSEILNECNISPSEMLNEVVKRSLGYLEVCVCDIGGLAQAQSRLVAPLKASPIPEPPHALLLMPTGFFQALGLLPTRSGQAAFSLLTFWRPPRPSRVPEWFPSLYGCMIQLWKLLPLCPPHPMK